MLAQALQATGCQCMPCGAYLVSVSNPEAPHKLPSTGRPCLSCRGHHRRHFRLPLLSRLPEKIPQVVIP